MKSVFNFLVQNLFPSNFSGNCDIEEERKFLFSIESNLFNNYFLHLAGRLMYVAITRAKKYLHMSYSETRSNYGQQEACQRSQFISEIPKSLLHIHEENVEPYEPPKKKINFIKQIQMPTQTGFVTGKNLMNIGHWKTKK